MRTTLTLDDDLEKKLRALAQRRGMTLKDVVNWVLRRGLAGPTRGEHRKTFKVRTFRSDFRPGVDPLRLNQLLDDLETERGGPGA